MNCKCWHFCIKAEHLVLLCRLFWGGNLIRFNQPQRTLESRTDEYLFSCHLAINWQYSGHRHVVWILISSLGCEWPLRSLCSPGKLGVLCSDRMDWFYSAILRGLSNMLCSFRPIWNNDTQIKVTAGRWKVAVNSLLLWERPSRGNGQCCFVVFHIQVILFYCVLKTFIFKSDFFSPKERMYMSSSGSLLPVPRKDLSAPAWQSTFLHLYTQKSDFSTLGQRELKVRGCCCFNAPLASHRCR